jgi:cytochrome c oxidase cbb3-type subunit 2
VVPESNMPGFPWLAENQVNGETIKTRMGALRVLGHPYTDEQIDGAVAAVDGKTEMDAMIAYLQNLGTNLR